MARLLLVDDDPLFGEVLKIQLSDFGHEVVLLESGDTVPELLREQVFDVLILDNYLGGMSGVEILHALNRQAEDTGWHRPPVVILSGDGSKEMELRARLAKSDFFLVKPCRGKELEERIQEVLKKKGESMGNDKDPVPAVERKGGAIGAVNFSAASKSGKRKVKQKGK